MTAPLPEPPRCLDAHQERIHAQLLRLSTGAASFFNDACTLLRLQLKLKALTNSVGHLCRETESALRDIVRPLFVDPKLREKQRSKGSEKEGHEREVIS